MYVATVSLTSIYVLAKIELHALAKSMLTKLYTLDKAYHLCFTVWPRMHLSTTTTLTLWGPSFGWFSRSWISSSSKSARFECYTTSPESRRCRQLHPTCAPMSHWYHSKIELSQAFPIVRHFSLPCIIVNANEKQGRPGNKASFSGTVLLSFMLPATSPLPCEASSTLPSILLLGREPMIGGGN